MLAFFLKIVKELLGVHTKMNYATCMLKGEPHKKKERYNEGGCYNSTPKLGLEEHGGQLGTAYKLECRKRASVMS